MPACQIREAKSLSLRPRAPARSPSGRTPPGAARGAVAVPCVYAGRPEQGGKVALLEAEGAGDVVKRDDDAAGGVGAELVAVHDPDVRPLAAPDRRGNGGVVVFPLHGVHLDVDFLVLGAELLDELAHEGPVPAREPIPERQFDLRALVGLPAVAARALHRRDALRPPAAPGHEQTRPSAG